MNYILAIIFDLDGTLVDSGPIHALAWVKAFAKFGYKLGLRDIGKLLGLTGPEIVTKITKSSDISLINAISNEKRNIFYKNIEKVKVFPNVYSTLDKIKKRYKVLLASSSSRFSINLILKHTHLDTYFDVIVGGNQIKKGKPNPEILFKVCKAAQVDPKRCIFVGDTKFDLLAGKRANIPVVAFLSGALERDYAIKYAKYVIKNFEELLSILK